MAKPKQKTSNAKASNAKPTKVSATHVGPTVTGKGSGQVYGDDALRVTDPTDLKKHEATALQSSNFIAFAIRCVKASPEDFDLAGALVYDRSKRDEAPVTRAALAAIGVKSETGKHAIEKKHTEETVRKALLIAGYFNPTKDHRLFVSHFGDTSATIDGKAGKLVLTFKAFALPSLA